MPIPDLCTLECVITGNYKLMNVIITRESRYSLSTVSKRQLTSSTIMSVVNIGGELPGLTLSTEGGWFSMSPLPRLHYHDMTIVGLFLIYIPFITIHHIRTIRYNRSRNVGALKVVNLHCSRLQSAVCCNRMVRA